MTEMINHPKHYESSSPKTRHILRALGVPELFLYGKCIEAIEALEWGFSLDSALKYLWRVDQKFNSLEDLAKARWYLNRHCQRSRRRLLYRVLSFFCLNFIARRLYRVDRCERAMRAIGLLTLEMNSQE